MLKKRLLSSVMASIMAVSAFSVVTSADATATTTEAPVEETKAVKTKAELKAYVDSFTGTYKADIYKFGTVNAERWLKAYDVADVVLAKEKATEEEVSNAYYYLSAADAALVTKTKEDLDGLVKKVKKTYDNANILNIDVGDSEYSADSYADFELAYNDATTIDATDAESITNAYFSLEDSYNALVKLDIVTKSEYAALIKKYDAAKNNVQKYETWRRGSTTVSGNTGDENQNASAAPKNLTWGHIINGTDGAGAAVKVANVEFAPFDEDGDQTDGIGNTDLYGSYNVLAGYASVNRTTDPTIVGDYKAGVITLDAVTNFKPDSYTRSSKAAVEKEIKDNLDDILNNFAKTLFTKITGSDLNVTTGADDFEAATKHVTELKYRINKDCTITGKPYDKNGDLAKSDVTYAAGKVIDLADFFKLEDVIDDTGVTGSLKTALTYANNYITAADFNGDPTNYPDNIDSAKRDGKSAAEWTLVFRAVKYAFADNGIPANAGETLADVQKLIASSYDCDKIESAHFQDLLGTVVDNRNLAIEAVRTKDDTYLVTTPDENDDFGDFKAAVKDFDDELANFKYAYSEIATALYEAKKNIDSDKYVITDAYTTAVDAVAKALISLNATNATEEPFDYYNEFIGYNRLYTAWNATAAESALKSAYEALVAIKLEEKPEFAAGDVNGDGKVDTADALLILDYTVDAAKVEGQTFHVEAADVNGDKTVDTADALAALDLAVKA